MSTLDAHLKYSRDYDSRVKKQISINFRVKNYNRSPAGILPIIERDRSWLARAARRDTRTLPRRAAGAYGAVVLRRGIRTIGTRSESSRNFQSGAWDLYGASVGCRGGLIGIFSAHSSRVSLFDNSRGVVRVYSDSYNGMLRRTTQLKTYS